MLTSYKITVYTAECLSDLIQCYQGMHANHVNLFNTSCKTDGIEAGENCQAPPWKGSRMERVPKRYPDPLATPCITSQGCLGNPYTKERWN